VTICVTESDMVSAEDAITIYQHLLDNGIQLWLTGGWGIDALVGGQTRPHKDLDLIMLLDDVGRMRHLLVHDGYDLKDLWEENRWVLDAHGVEAATAFVLHDSLGREIDAHAMRLDSSGDGLPAWDAEGLVFSSADLAGQGTIAGLPVRCLSPEAQLLCHTGYDLPDYQVRDLELLREKFGALPGIASSRAPS